MLLIAGFVRFDPQQRDATRAAILDQVRATREEPGCIRYIVAEDVEQPGTLRVMAEWVSWEALVAHFRTPHMDAFHGRVGWLGVREFTLQKYLIDFSGPFT